MYKANAAAPSEPVAEAGSAEEPKKDEGVIDAEYVDVDEKK
jgi:molecular chaperone DnaK